MKLRRVFTLHSALFILVSGFLSMAGAGEKHQQGEAKQVSLPGSSLYHLESSWTDQKGGKVLLARLEGKPRIVAMVYTQCPTACPLLVQDIKSIVGKLPKEKAEQLNVDLFSFDPKDDAKKLEQFRAKYKLGENWSAYSASAETVAELASALDVRYKLLAGGEYIHSNILFLVSDKGEILARHEGLKRDSAEFVKKILTTLEPVSGMDL